MSNNTSAGSVQATRIKQALDNWDEYVDILTTFSDKRLVEKLDTISMQFKIAYDTKNEASIELLEIWRRQTIEARILKAENNIPDAPNEIELAIADIKTTVVKTEERQEIFNEGTNFNKVYKPNIKEEDKNQTSLF